MRDLLLGPVEQVAPRLLGATVTSDLGGARVAVRVVEVEAYGGADDPASHAYRGMTRRNASMFGPPGMCYVYFTYGMHWCMNVVTGREGEGAAVLLRAAEVVDGSTVVQPRRTTARGRQPTHRDLARGPGRLAACLGVTGAQDGMSLADSGGPLRLCLPRERAAAVSDGPRVGVSTAVERRWRFWLTGEPTVSAYRSGRRRTQKRGREA